MIPVLQTTVPSPISIDSFFFAHHICLRICLKIFCGIIFDVIFQNDLKSMSKMPSYAKLNLP